MRWLFVLLGAAILAAAAALVVVLPDGPAKQVSQAARTKPAASANPTPKVSEFTDGCGTFETKESAPYAVTGYWITPTVDHCTWRRQMKEIHDLGGDTVIRIGYGLQFRPVDDQGRILTKDEGQVDPLYKPCQEDRLSCHDAAERDLQAVNKGNRIARTYVYRTDESFGPNLFRCPELEHKIVVGKRVYFRVLAPTDGSDDPSCDFTTARNYDLILIVGAAQDSLTELLDLGDQFGMRVFPALPLAPRDPKKPTQANEKHIGTLTTLTRRILQDYGVRFADRDSLGGVYQPFEVQMAASLAGNPTLKVYADQHTIVEQELPNKPILISPYLDARKRVAFGQTPQQVAEAFRALAETGVGIIAPQDSRGTGKVGLFWPDQRGNEVDQRLQSVVGETTYNTAYHGSTRDYYREMAVARDEMLQAGHQVDLWANIEAFEPAGDHPCAPTGTRGKTDKERLDQAITMAGRYVQKIVSYMWSDYYTCGSPSLETEIGKDWQRPIAVDAIRQARDIQDGFQVRGYNLKGGTVTVEFSAATGDASSTGITEDLVIADVGWLDENPLEDLPEGMQTAWVPFDWARVPPGEWVRIGVKSPTGQATTELLHVRIST